MDLNEGFGAIYAHYYAQQAGEGGPVMERSGIVERYLKMVTGGIPELDAVNGLINPPQVLTESQEQVEEAHRHHHFLPVYDYYYARGYDNDLGRGRPNVYPDNPMRKYVEMLRRGKSVDKVISEMFE